MKVAIIGSRSIEKIDFALANVQEGDEIVTGGARGVDSLAEKEARKNGQGVIVFKPDYEKYGRAAPHVRNRLIVGECDRLVAFWDGVSKGTESVIRYAEKHGTAVQIIKV